MKTNEPPHSCEVLCRLDHSEHYTETFTARYDRATRSVYAVNRYGRKDSAPLEVTYVPENLKYIIIDDILP